MGEWKTVSLGDVCEVIGGGTPSKKNDAFYQGDIPWATVRDMKNDVITKTDFSITDDAVKNSSTNIIKANNVVIATRVGLGKVCLINQDTAINQDLRGIVPKNNSKLDVRFLFWWLKSVSKTIVDEGTGATVQGVKLSFVKSLQIPLPSPSEQKRIVALLDEAFAGIDTAIANTKKNLANARELFESYLYTIFTRQDDGWVRERMSDVCEGKITDGTHQTPKYFDDGYIFLSSKNVTSRSINWDNIKYIDESQHIAMQKRLSPRVNDILLAKNGTTGVAAIVDRDVVFDIYVSLALLRPSEKILPRYLLHFVNSPVAKEQFNKRLKGVGVPNLHLKEIREVLVYYPVSIEEQEIVVNKIDELLIEQKRLESIYQQKLNSLNELKQSLLQKAFSGELTAAKATTEAILKEEEIA